MGPKQQMKHCLRLPIAAHLGSSIDRSPNVATERLTVIPVSVNASV